MTAIVILGFLAVFGLIFLLISKKVPNWVKGTVLLLVGIGVNILVIPVSLFIGVMATDAPGSGVREFIIGILFIQAIPLLFLIGCIVFFIAMLRKPKEKGESL
ncbi:hypothetical protein GKZ89_15805 [Bacillus mangrovi]|uniref:Uncharacterized protein n=1 Tax=Metabacillus mangrovi TaxID=1491830 RepID=A0A7X2V5J2_9BACI|nr:hypothetical protein [Metabacillus mangrovi]MTH54867.1 hypothetical protein [Metabacillus mangrovi]